MSYMFSFFLLFAIVGIIASVKTPLITPTKQKNNLIHRLLALITEIFLSACASMNVICKGISPSPGIFNEKREKLLS